jgi:flagellar biosynthetic protein FliR
MHLPVTEVYLFLAIFARIGTMIMLFPVFGEITVTPRVRLSLALAISALLMPVVRSRYPALPDSLGPLMGMLFGEIFVGVLIGSAARLISSALQVAGNIISMQTGLSFAQNFDPTQGIQGALVGTFLSLVAMTLLVVTDMHHLMLGALAGSYTRFVPGTLPAMGDSLALILDTSVDAFVLGMQLSAPFIVFGLVFYMAMGLLAKLMPQVQIFFVVTPATILLGLALLMILMGAMMNFYLDRFQAHLTPFTG